MPITSPAEAIVEPGPLAWKSPESLRWLVLAVPAVFWSGETLLVEVLSFLHGLAPAHAAAWRLGLGTPAVLVVALLLIAGPRVNQRTLQVGLLVMVLLSAMVNFVVLQLTPATFPVLNALLLTTAAVCMYFRPRVVVWLLLVLGAVMLSPLVAPTPGSEHAAAPAWLAVYMAVFVIIAAAVLIVRTSLAANFDEYLAQAETDPLTGLSNLRKLREVAQAAEQSTDPAGGLLLLDLDDFKAVNTLYGHAGGDQALCVVAQALSAAALPGHTIARIGGDELAVLVPMATTAELEALALIYRRAVCAGNADLGLAGVTLDVSVGVASRVRNGVKLTELLSAADRSLYTAKASRVRQRVAAGGSALLSVPSPAGGLAKADGPSGVLARLYSGSGYWRLFSASLALASSAMLLATFLPGANQSHETIVLGLVFVGFGSAVLVALRRPSVYALSSPIVDTLVVAAVIMLLRASGGLESPMLMLVFLIGALQGTGVPRPMGLRFLAPALALLSPLLYQPVFTGPHAALQVSLFIASVTLGTILCVGLFGGQKILAELADRSQAEATIDPLTQLLNRRAFTDELERELRSTASRLELAVLIIDLDNFGDVNSKYGHQRGDLLLREIAAALRSVMRDGDTVARVGGDEFAAILKDVQADDAYTLAAKFIETVAACTARSGDAVIATVTASAGCAVYPRQGTTIDELMARADTALMGIKHAGKNAVATTRVALVK